MKLSQAINEYVHHRRVEGSTYVHGEDVLRSLCRRLGDPTIGTVRAEHVMNFVSEPHTSLVTRKGKHSILSRFFRHWSLRGGMPELILPSPPRCIESFVPHVYGRGQVARLLSAVEEVQKKSRSICPRTIRMFLLTLHATGAVVNEVIQLRLSQLEIDTSHLNLPGDQRTRKRRIPICLDLREEFRLYLAETGRNCQGDHLLFSKRSGDPISKNYLNDCFQRLLRLTLVVRQDAIQRTPRLQDFRATFAVHRITSWIEKGNDLSRMLPALSTYMGYSELSGADKYLRLVPERSASDLRRLSPGKPARHWRDDPQLISLLRGL